MGKLLVILAFCFAAPAFGQTFRNVRVLREEEKVIIIYDLIFEESGSKVIVNIFGSHNKFSKPLSNATGDVGEVLPGPNRRITWTPDNTIKKIENVTFQFKGDIIHGWKILKPDNGKLKRGKRYTLKWQGGYSYDSVTIKLISPLQKTMEIAKIKNTGSYQWRVPKNIATKSGFTLRLSCGKEFAEEKVTIKRKFPLFIIAIPVAGAAIFFGLSGDDGNKGSGSLPDAPKPD